MRQQLQFKAPEFNQRLFFGGSLTTTRAHRRRRPLSTKQPIHLVLRSSRARDALSFWRTQNRQIIERATAKQAARHGVRVLKLVNVGNHLHLLVRLTRLRGYAGFIRGLTGTIGLLIGTRVKSDAYHGDGCAPRPSSNKLRFWDFRPFTRVLVGRRAYFVMQDYLRINELQGLGFNKIQAKEFLADTRWPPRRDGAG